MNPKLITALMLVWICASQCSKPSDDNAPLIDVTHYTPCDITAQPMGPADSSDWRYDTTWTSQEQALFPALSAADLAGAQKSNLNIWYAYPNPASNMAFWQTGVSSPTLLHMVITDDHLIIKDRITGSTIPNTVQLNLSDTTKYLNHTTYRLYYAFYSQADGMYYKGHGDIRIERK